MKQYDYIRKAMRDKGAKGAKGDSIYRKYIKDHYIR